jgi:putative transposase
MIKITLVEKHSIKINNKYFKTIDDYSFKVKNLYNYANFIIRQEFVKNKRWIRYSELEKLCKGSEPYKNLMAQTAQQTLKLLDKNWTSFFSSIKDWSKNKDKYTGKPSLPKYKDKLNGRYNIIFTNQNCKIKDGKVVFPKVMGGLELRTKVVKGLQQVRIKPNGNSYTIEIVYKIDDVQLKEDNSKYISLDIGLDNLATITNNFGDTPIILNGKNLKSINKYYNKLIAHYNSLNNGWNKSKKRTKRMKWIDNKRNNLLDNLIHKYSRLVVDYAICNDVSVIIIGNNKDWKRESKMSKLVNQSFVGIPHQKFIDKIIYKAEISGIKVILTEESYTSGTSFLDNELPVKYNYNKNRRVKRGLFKSNKGTLINADVNGSYQIMKKVFPNVFDHGIEDCGFNPIRVGL